MTRQSRLPEAQRAEKPRLHLEDPLHRVPHPNDVTAPATNRKPKITSLAKLPLPFIENRGQVNEGVKYYLRAGSHTLWFTTEGVIFDNVRSRESPQEQLRSERFVFSEVFVNSNKRSAIEAGNVQPGIYNYFIGNDPAKWRTGVRAYSELVYKNLWDGIDLRVYAKGRDLEQEFIVRPGADTKLIHVAYQGIQGLHVSEDGSLLISTASGQLREGKPRIYQETDGRQVPVEGRFNLMGRSAYTFELGHYKSDYAVVIDPTIIYSSYLGRSNTDLGEGIAVDTSGNAYVIGTTFSTNFPTVVPLQPNLTQGCFGGFSCFDAFVSKINASGTALVYSTYLGGPGFDQGRAIAVDSFGNAYVTGEVQGAFPTTPGAFNTSSNGEGFVAKINASGSSLLYSTFIRGSGWGITVDTSGNAYVTGDATFCRGDTTPNAFQTICGGGLSDAFVLKLNAAGSGLVYGAFLGGTNDDRGHAIALDNAGYAYVVGRTASPNFPTMNPFQSVLKGSADAFVTKVSPTGSVLAYSTYLGGTGAEELSFTFFRLIGIAVDSSGSAYVTGTTDSSDFPTVNPLVPSIPGRWSGFVTKFDATGSRLVYSTYLDTGFSHPSAIALDSTGNPQESERELTK